MSRRAKNPITACLIGAFAVGVLIPDRYTAMVWLAVLAVIGFLTCVCEPGDDE